MMPLSAPNAQVINVIGATKLPDAWLNRGQVITVNVVSVQGNQVVLAAAGRQFTAQSQTPLVAGQTLNAQPSVINGQVQLKILPQDAPNTSLPQWTNTLSNTTQQTLSAIKQNLPHQASLQTLLNLVNTLVKPPTGESTITQTTPWQSLLNLALLPQANLTGEKVFNAIRQFNDKFAQQKNVDWKPALASLIEDPNADPLERTMAQQLLNRSELIQQFQSLHHSAGSALWLQEIPINLDGHFESCTLELESPTPEQEEATQTWKVLLQLNLALGEFTGRIQLDSQLNLKVQLWGSTTELTQLISQQTRPLHSALTELGLKVESLIVAQGKPPTKMEQPLWKQPLIDCYS